MFFEFLRALELYVPGTAYELKSAKNKTLKQNLKQHRVHQTIKATFGQVLAEKNDKIISRFFILFRIVGYNRPFVFD